MFYSGLSDRYMHGLLWGIDSVNNTFSKIYKYNHRIIATTLGSGHERATLASVNLIIGAYNTHDLIILKICS